MSLFILNGLLGFFLLCFKCGIGIHPDGLVLFCFSNMAFNCWIISSTNSDVDLATRCWTALLCLAACSVPGNDCSIGKKCSPQLEPDHTLCHTVSLGEYQLSFAKQIKTPVCSFHLSQTEQNPLRKSKRSQIGLPTAHPLHAYVSVGVKNKNTE